MILGIHQPQFMPWLGYFDKIIQSDTFVFLDDVQYKKNEWQNRNRIKTVNGPQWLTVPVHYQFLDLMNSVKIDNTSNWQKKHLAAFATNYGKARYYKEITALFSDIYSTQWENIADLNVATVMAVVSYLGIKTTTIRSSEFPTTGTATERLISICKHLKADTYLSGVGGKGYIQEKLFTDNAIALRYQDYGHPEYPQLFDGFVSHLSILDLLFNCGPEAATLLKVPLR